MFIQLWKVTDINPVDEVIKEMKQLYDLELEDFGLLIRSLFQQKNILKMQKYYCKLLDQGWKDISWAAYIRADNIDADLAQLMVDTGMSYFEIGIATDLKNQKKNELAYDLETVLNIAEYWSNQVWNHVSVNYSFNVFDETPSTIRQTIAYQRELENILGKT